MPPNNDIERRLWSAADELRVSEYCKRQRTRAAVQVTIRDTLNNLPPVYDDALFQEKLDCVYKHVSDSYYGAGRSIYGRAGGYRRGAGGGK